MQSRGEKEACSHFLRLLCCFHLHFLDFQDIAQPADGVWRWDFRECLSPSRGEPLQGRWRAHNPTAWVRGLQTCRQTSAVESCCGAPSTGHPCDIWLQQLLPMSTKYHYIRTTPSRIASPFLTAGYCCWYIGLNIFNIFLQKHRLIDWLVKILQCLIFSSRLDVWNEKKKSRKTTQTTV